MFSVLILIVKYKKYSKSIINSNEKMTFPIYVNNFVLNINPRKKSMKKKKIKVDIALSKIEEIQKEMKEN